MPNILKRIKNRIETFHAAPGPSSYPEVERAEQMFYLKYLQEDMIIFDVGANVGELTLLFSRFAYKGKVHSFEPSSSAFQKLETICRAANRSNVINNNLALSDKKGSLCLYIYGEEYLSFNSQADRPFKDYGLDIKPIKTETVTAATVDDYCHERGIRQIDLLKIDVEGAELQVMKGARRMLESKSIKCLTFEFGQTTFDMGNRPEEIEKFLKAMNYSIRNIIDGEPNFPGRETVASAVFSMHTAFPDK
jgi:FkbM family methyltransferase